MLKNLNPYQGINFKILREAFLNKKINLSELTDFGCKILFHNRYKQGNLYNNSKQNYFHMKLSILYSWNKNRLKISWKSKGNTQKFKYWIQYKIATKWKPC